MTMGSKEAIIHECPAKQADRRKPIVEQLKVDDEEDFVPNPPSNRKSIALESTDIEGSIALKFRYEPGRPNAFTERMKDVADDEEDELVDPCTC